MITAYRRKTVSGELAAIVVNNIKDEYDFFYSGDTYNDVEKAVEEETEFSCSGTTLFLVTKD